MLNYVFLTGGHSQIPGFDKRIRAELVMMSRVGTSINVVKSYDAQLDAWRGGAWLARNYLTGQSFGDFTITK